MGFFPSSFQSRWSAEEEEEEQGFNDGTSKQNSFGAKIAVLKGFLFLFRNLIYLYLTFILLFLEMLVLDGKSTL